MKSIYKRVNPVEEILGNGMRGFLRGKMIQLHAKLIDKNKDFTRFSFQLDQEGYVVQFPEPIILSIVMPTKAVTQINGDVYEVNEKYFKKACAEHMAKLRERLVVKYGANPSLVRADVTNVYPM